MVENNGEIGKFRAKNPPVPLIAQQTQTKRLLKYLCLVQKPVTYKEISEDTGISYATARSLIRFLNNFKAITKNYEVGPATSKIPPKVVLHISLNEKQIKNARWILKL